MNENDILLHVRKGLGNSIVHFHIYNTLVFIKITIFTGDDVPTPTIWTRIDIDTQVMHLEKALHPDLPLPA